MEELGASNSVQLDKLFYQLEQQQCPKAGLNSTSCHGSEILALVILMILWTPAFKTPQDWKLQNSRFHM